ncbi:hypothetical protein D9M68_340400 [compost metagenome]
MKGQHGFIGIPQHAHYPSQPHYEGWFASLLTRLKRWQQLTHERDQLASMSDELLKDIGLSRADVMEESERHFWQDPLKK